MPSRARPGRLAVSCRAVVVPLSLVALTIGIVGLPNAGKSTVFNALTRNSVLAASYAFATIQPNVGVVGVPDPRLATLAKMFDSARVVPATVQFVDIAGIVRGASEGEGLGNKFLSYIRESDAICQVTRMFRDDEVSHVHGEVSPADDISIIATELTMADLQTVEKALPRLEKEARLRKENAAALDAASRARAALESGTPISATSIDRALIRELMLLTAKPQLYVFNCDADELADEDLKIRMRELVAPAEAIFLDAKFESDLVELEDDEEARAMLAELGVDEPGLEVLARVGFDTLGLQTFLTAGPKEARAWTIRRGATAPEAAGVIHTDFQRGFIKAEIVSYQDLIQAGSTAAARAAGKVRIEGKDYVMAEGDVVEFRFNV
jgi:GTP-binding protein YchF